MAGEAGFVGGEHRRHDSNAGAGAEPGARSDSGDEAALRRLGRRIRRHKVDLERRNPLEDGEYLSRFEALIALEAERRDVARRRRNGAT